MSDPTRPKITRNRELRACTQCRRRKLKCDRLSPCTACSRRNAAAGCVYDRNGLDLQEEHNSRLRAEARLEDLELLVQHLQREKEMGSDANGNSNATADDVVWSGNAVQYATSLQNKSNGNCAVWHSNSEELATTMPTTDVIYNGSTHWSAMAEDIEELRSHNNSDAELELFSIDNEGIGLLLGAGRTLSYPDILSQFLPPRREADRLVAAYFRSKALVAPFIHSGQFSRFYLQFWHNTSAASPLWTSMLFSILDISTRILSVGSSIKYNRFAIAAAHCLAAGSYFRPQPCSVEALLLYCQRSCLTSVDVSPDVGILFGALMRLAISQGYHRDPSKTSRFSPFVAEMRRRTWSLAMQLDLLVSFQLGLPSNVQYPTWDTLPPSNLLDADLDESIVKLPPPRPDTEPTDVLFYIAKHKLMAVYEKIVRLANSIGEYPVSDLDSIDTELRSTHASLPAVFELRSMAESIADPPSIVVTRLCVEFIYQKCLCALHRRFVTRGRIESVQICFTAATDLVRRFLDIRNEFEPGGQLETERWFMGSLSWHDFLLGCMALCLVLCATRQMTVAAAFVDLPTSLELLAEASKMCQERELKSGDTRRVRRLIEATVSRLRDDNEAWCSNDSTMPVDDEWAFLEQFLNLPDESIDPLLLEDLSR